MKGKEKSFFIKDEKIIMIIIITNAVACEWGRYSDQFPANLANERDFYGVNKTKSSDVYLVKLAVLICGLKRKISRIHKSHESGHEGIQSIAWKIIYFVI